MVVDGHVNVITGDYVEKSQDLSFRLPIDFGIAHTGTSLWQHSPFSDGFWHYSYDSAAVFARTGWEGKKWQSLVMVGEHSGGNASVVHSFSSKNYNSESGDSVANQAYDFGYNNISRGYPSARHEISNYHITCLKDDDDLLPLLETCNMLFALMYVLEMVLKGITIILTTMKKTMYT